jgi:hypothetical protein
MIRPTHISSTANKTKESKLIPSVKKTSLLFVGYYLLIASVVGWKVTDTLVTSATVIGHRTELRQLAQEQKELENTKNQYTAKIADTYSLSQFDQSALKDFEPMHNVVSVNLTQYLAQR